MTNEELRLQCLSEAIELLNEHGGTRNILIKKIENAYKEYKEYKKEYDKLTNPTEADRNKLKSLKKKFEDVNKLYDNGFNIFSDDYKMQNCITNTNYRYSILKNANELKRNADNEKSYFANAVYNSKRDKNEINDKYCKTGRCKDNLTNHRNYMYNADKERLAKYRKDYEEKMKK